MDIKELKSFQHSIRRGSSLPLVFESIDGVAYFVKLKANGEGTTALICDWIASHIGRIIELPILEPQLVLVKKNVISKDEDPEIVDLVVRSDGINFGTIFLEKSTEYTAKHELLLSDKQKSNTFLFDLFLGNFDRTHHNSNLLICKNQYYILDFSASTLLRAIISNRRFNRYTILKKMKSHPYYGFQSTKFEFIRKLKEISLSEIQTIIQNVPDEWICELNVPIELNAIKNQIFRALSKKLKMAASLSQDLDLLKAILPEHK